MPSVGRGASRSIPSMSSHSIPSDPPDLAMVGPDVQGRPDGGLESAGAATVEVSVTGAWRASKAPHLPMNGTGLLTMEWE